MATLDKLAEDRKKAKHKKKTGGMDAAVANTEKIRSWVYLLFQF
jgi:outer membrane murein-binding lipoprotein Lpp